MFASTFLIYMALSSTLSLPQNYTVPVKFYLSEGKSPDRRTLVDGMNVGSLIRDKQTHIIFIVHGWLEDSNTKYYDDLKNVMLKKNKRTCVIFVDWSVGSRDEYDRAIKCDKFVGNSLGKLIVDIIETCKIMHNQYEIIGHSMGCHIAGFAGKTVKQLTGKKIRRITALDPFGPLYSRMDESNRLSEHDAEVVAVMHTDGFKFGYGQACGTIDVYPNGGVEPQPGCHENKSVVEYDLCSHQRSTKYYLEAMKTNKFLVTKCTDYKAYKSGKCSWNKVVNFAGEMTADDVGTFFADTDSKAPFLTKKKRK